MIKKGLNILVLLMTSIVLLAHAVVPHHHHNQQVCVVAIHSGHKSDADKHSCNDENHKHNHNSDDLSCILEKIVMLRSGHSDQDDKFTLSSDDGTDSFFITVFSNPESSEFYSRKLKNTSPPDLEKSYTSQAPKSFGLRAPPLV